ncbi:MAG: histidine phosphatase family protein [Natronomonas sp.]
MILVVRHGETDWNRNERMQGWAPVPLNDRGREQATELGTYLGDAYEIDRIVASDLRRAEETAHSLTEAGEIDVPVSTDSDWRERNLGVYQGLRLEDVRRENPKFALGENAAQAARERPENGESLRAVADRVTAAFDALPDSGTTLVVTHSGPIALLLGYANGQSVGEAIFEHRLENCSITAFETAGDAESPSIRRMNDTPWKEADR